MKTPSQLVREFHERFELVIRHKPTGGIPVAEIAFRQGLHTEELIELHEAMDARDLVGIADALADSFYVLAGTALHYGIDLDAILAEVHRSNMTKEPAGHDSKKAIKGASFSPPNLGPLLAGGDGPWPAREAA